MQLHQRRQQKRQLEADSALRSRLDLFASLERRAVEQLAGDTGFRVPNERALAVHVDRGGVRRTRTVAPTAPTRRATTAGPQGPSAGMVTADFGAMAKPSGEIPE